MSEMQEVAGKLGITFRVPIEKRIAGAEKVGPHKTSMLQERRGRPRDRARSPLLVRCSSWPG